MRISKSFSRSGYFWIPDNEEKKIPGTLKITDGGKIELEVVDLFEEDVNSSENGIDFKRIIGYVEKDGLVTLEDCFYGQKNYSFNGIAKSLLHVNQLLCGVGYQTNEPIVFNSVSFTVEGLNEWLDINGITVTYDEGRKSATIDYDPQGELVYDLTDGFKLHIYFIYTLPGFSHDYEAKIAQQAFLRISSIDAKELSEYIEKIHHITYMLCFAIDETVAVSNVSAISDNAVIQISEGKKAPANIKIYFESRPFSIGQPKISRHKMLFRFDHVSGSFEKIINSWFHAYSKIRPALSLYFSSATNTHKFLESRFLFLIQGLETYHRKTSSETRMEENRYEELVSRLVHVCSESHREWLESRLKHGNEISLRQRIKRIIQPYKSLIGNNKRREQLIASIVDTRNYLTHYEERLRVRAASGNDLWDLCMKLEAIFQLLILKELGFEKNEIESILSRNYKLKQKLDNI